MITRFRFHEEGDVFSKYDDDPRLQYFLSQLKLRKQAEVDERKDAARRHGFHR